MKILKYAESVAALAAVVGVIYAMYNGQQNLKTSYDQFQAQQIKQDSLFSSQQREDSIDFERELKSQEIQFLRKMFLDSIQFEEQLKRYDQELRLLYNQFNLSKSSNDTTLKFALQKLEFDKEQLVIYKEIAQKSFDLDITKRGIIRELEETSNRIESLQEIKIQYLADVDRTRTEYFESKTTINDFKTLLVQTVRLYGSKYEKYTFTDRIYREADPIIVSEIFDTSYPVLEAIHNRISEMQIQPYNPFDKINEDIIAFNFSEKRFSNNLKKASDMEKANFERVLLNVDVHFKRLDELKKEIDRFLIDYIDDPVEVIEVSADFN